MLIEGEEELCYLEVKNYCLEYLWWQTVQVTTPPLDPPPPQESIKGSLLTTNAQLLYGYQRGNIVSISIIMAPKTKLVAFHPVHGYKIKPQQDLKTIKRNERERKRVETVNRGFETLRQHVPTAAQIKKLSKVSILTEAMDYIQYLYGCLQQSASDPVLLHYSQTAPPSSPLLPHHHHHQHSDQGFYSDHSQPSPVSWPHHLPYKHQPGYAVRNESHLQYTPRQETPLHFTPKHEAQSPLSQCGYPPQSAGPAIHLPSSGHHEEGESSGEEDDILDAIAEWQQH